MIRSRASERRPLYRALADALHDVGVRTVFGLMGEDTASLTVGIIERGIRYLGTRHEAVAVGMADGYSWAAEELGVCMVTRGPGVMNAATACRTAIQGRRRLLLLTGDGPTAGERAFDYKYIDQRPLAAALGMRYFTVALASDGLGALADAIESARGGHPTMLAIPADLFDAEVTGAFVAPHQGAEVVVPDPPSADVLARLLDILRDSRAPLILAGRGAATPDAALALEQLAERSGALLGTTLIAKDLFRGHRLDLGVVGGFASDPAAELLGEVDCVLAFGARLTPFTTAQRTLFGDAIVVQIDSDRESLGASFPVSLGVVADAGDTARALVERLPAGDRGKAPPFHRAEILARLTAPLYAGPDEGTPNQLDPRIAAVMFDRLLPPERTVVLDSGRFMTSPGRFVRVPGPSSFRLTADAGSIAVGFGVALGAAVARPQAANVLFIGDGGMSMTMGDLETAARHSIPIIVVVMNDRAYGAEFVHLQADGLPTRYAALPELDFAAVASSLGVEARTATSIADLESIAPLLADRNGPLLVDCKIRQDITAARLRWSEQSHPTSMSVPAVP